MEGPVNDEEEVDKAAWKRSETVDHAMGLLTLHFFNHLHVLLENSMLYAVKHDSLAECSAVQQFCFTAPALTLSFATSGSDIAAGRATSDVSCRDSRAQS